MAVVARYLAFDLEARYNTMTGKSKMASWVKDFILSSKCSYQPLSKSREMSFLHISDAKPHPVIPIVQLSIHDSKSSTIHLS
jgi:hypothetical protein